MSYFRRDEKTLEKIYERDKASGSFIISVALDRYVDVFNELDSAPWRRRDLDHDLRIFLEDCSADIPFRYDIILQFNVEQEKQDNLKEEKLKVGLKTYFSFVRISLQKKIRNSYERSIFYVLGSFFLLFASYSLRTTSNNLILISLFEVVSIGGWVFLWEAISTLAFTSREARDKYKQYERFSTAKIRFNYIQTNPKES
jgi:hypothetical protein